MKKTILTITDEVNCRFHDLDLNTRKKLANRFKFVDHSKKFTPAVRLGRWDGSVSFFSMGGATFINLLPDILPILEEEGYSIELNDQREYTTYFDLEPVTETSFSHVKWPEGHQAAGQPVLLRDYQVEVINNFLNNPQALGQIATGAGKCVTAETRININIDPNSDFGRYILREVRDDNR